MAGNAARWRQLVRSAAFIGGRWEAAANGRTFAVTNPASGHVIGHVPDLCVSATRRAIDAAHQRQTSWQNTAPKASTALSTDRTLHSVTTQTLTILIFVVI